jgi:hypothetical protein
MHPARIKLALALNSQTGFKGFMCRIYLRL